RDVVACRVGVKGGSDSRADEGGPGGWVHALEIGGAGQGTGGGHGDGGQQFTPPQRGGFLAEAGSVSGEEVSGGHRPFAVAAAQVGGRGGGQDNRRAAPPRAGFSP